MLLVSKYIPTQFDNNFKPMPQWMNKSAFCTIKKKRKMWLKYQSTLLPIDYIEYARCRNASTQAVRGAKYNFEMGLINDLSVNPKRFWKYVQSKTKVKQSVASINKPDGTITVDDIEIASVLNNFFDLFSLMKIFQICHL